MKLSLLSLFGNSPIITPRMPQLPMEAANKQYVDDLVGTHASNTPLHQSLIST